MQADQPPLIPAPDDPHAWPAWRDGLEKWRGDARTAQRYNGSTYDDPEFAWMQSCFAFGKVMLFDRMFVDPAKGEFLVEPWLDWMEDDFGGLDALILWQAYPRIGVDSRNQYDHYRDVPGGIPNLRRLVDRLHARGVKAALAYNPWDTGTRREPRSDSEALSDLCAEAGFDGIFLDTMPQGGPDLRAAVDKARPGVVLESELALPIDAISSHHASWAQWFDDSAAPGVMRNRWYEQRHMMHLIRRWDLDHSGELQMAWMNGAGMLIWQNIFGSWNGWNDRDRSILRAMLPIQRRYARHFSHGEWTPLVETSGDGLFASSWALDGVALWTCVNRSDRRSEGYVQGLSNDGSHLLYDLVRGSGVDHGHLSIEPRGIGCLLSIPSSQVSPEFEKFLREQAERHKGASWEVRRVEPMPVPVPQRAIARPDARHLARSRFRARECGEYGYALLAYQAYPGLHQEKTVERPVPADLLFVGPEVTNADYLQFLEESGYKPASTENFLAHWEKGKPKPGHEHKPVVYVDLADARSYADWARLRLPTEDEWQAASEVLYGGPSGVWNWTDSEHTDGRTTFSILKGGCAWEAKGSGWYFDSGPKPGDWSAKLIHFWPGMDRSETIGFRCILPRHG